MPTSAISNDFDTFFLSGWNYVEVMWTPGGNIYYNLAFRYVAAKLNVLGVEGSVAAAYPAEIETIFQTYTPEQFRALKGSNALRERIVFLMIQLDKYNNGRPGAPYCSAGTAQ